MATLLSLASSHPHQVIRFLEVAAVDLRLINEPVITPQARRSVPGKGDCPHSADSNKGETLGASASVGALFALCLDMSAEHQRRAKCEQCGLSFIEVDAYGERLQGCVGCNQWRECQSGDWRRLPDVAALRGIGTAWRRPIGV
jgi:hypothetical protein